MRPAGCVASGSRRNAASARVVVFAARSGSATYDAQANDDAMQAYIRDAAGGSSNELATLAELHSSGKLTDDEYAQAKAKAIS